MKLKSVLLALTVLLLPMSVFSLEVEVDIAKTALGGSWKVINESKYCPNNIQISFIKGQWPRVESDFGQRPFDPKEINSGDQFSPFIFTRTDPITESNAHSISLYFESEATLKFIDKTVLVNSKNLQIVLTKSSTTTNYRTIKNGQELLFEQVKDQVSDFQNNNVIYTACRYRKN